MNAKKRKTCQHVKSHCYNSRELNGVRWRRRECVDCGERWTTVEHRVEMKSGRGNTAEEALRAAMGLTVRQQRAIGELIQSFLEPEEDDEDAA